MSDIADYFMYAYLKVIAGFNISFIFTMVILDSRKILHDQPTVDDYSVATKKFKAYLLKYRPEGHSHYDQEDLSDILKKLFYEHSNGHGESKDDKNEGGKGETNSFPYIKCKQKI